jgi:hypothetical protein
MATIDGFIVPRNAKNEVPFFNLSGSDIPAFTVLSLDTVNTLGVQLAANPGEVGVACVPAPIAGSPIPVGVSIADTPAGYQGTMQIYGWIYVVADGAIAVGAFVAPSTTTAGRVITTPGAVPCLGVNMSTTTAGADLTMVQIAICKA